jgi:hypothetical protein
MLIPQSRRAPSGASRATHLCGYDYEAFSRRLLRRADRGSLVVAWHFLGMTSQVGTIVDALPGLIGLSYFLVSKRVRNTFAPAIDEEDDALAP